MLFVCIVHYILLYTKKVAIWPRVIYNSTCLGYLSDLEPPFPIPNKEVKRVSADDTRRKSRLGKLGRSQGIFFAILSILDFILYTRSECLPPLFMKNALFLEYMETD